jgi:hypothetical protein
VSASRRIFGSRRSSGPAKVLTCRCGTGFGRRRRKGRCRPGAAVQCVPGFLQSGRLISATRFQALLPANQGSLTAWTEIPFS